MKTKRRYMPPIDSPPIEKLAMQSLDLANNNIVFTKDYVEVFREAIGYSNI